MAVAFDAATEGTFTTEDPITLAHTPAGTPTGVVAILTRHFGGTDNIAAANPTYGGVSMGLPVEFGGDTADETGAAWLWFLAAPPTGPQSFSLDVAVTGGVKHLVIITLTGTGLEVAASGNLSNDVANPQITLDSGADTALRIAGIFGGSILANYTPVAGTTLVHDHAYTLPNASSIVQRQTTPSSGSFTMGWTNTIDDVGMVAVAIREGAVGPDDNYVLLPGAATDHVDTPDAAALDITGDIDIRILAAIDVIPQTRNQNLITKGDPGSLTGSWLLRVVANTSQLRFGWRTNTGQSVGQNSLTGLAIDSGHRWYRVTLDVDDGAGSHVVTFYFSNDPVTTAAGSVTWTQHSQHTIAGTTTILAGSEPVVIGNRSDQPNEALAGKVYYAAIRNGIAGTLVASPDFRDEAQKTGPQQFTDPQGLVWTMTGNVTWVTETGTGGTTNTLAWRPFDIETYFGRGSESIDFIIELLPIDFVIDRAGSVFTATTGAVVLPWRPANFVTDADRWTVEVEVVGGPPPPPPPLPVISTENILSSFALSIRVGLELLDQNDAVLADISDDLLTGVVARNMNADIHGTARLRISRALNWHNQRLRPYLVATELITAISERFDLGIYLPETPSRVTGQSPATYDVEAYDKLVILNHPHGIAYTAGAGVGVVATVESILDDRGVSHAIDQTSAATVPSTRSWPLDPQNTTLRIVNDLLASINYRALYVDRTGVFRSEAYRAPGERAPVWHYDASSSRTIIGEEITEEIDLFSIPNWWVFVRDDPAQVAPVEGNGIYTVLNQNDGISSINARGRVITKVERLDVADHASLVALGNQIVQRDRQPFAHLQFTAVPNPLHWHADSVTVTSPELGLIGVIFGEQSWSLPLDGGDMTHNVRRSVSI